MEIKKYYWIIFTILLITLIWSIKNNKTKNSNGLEGFEEGFEDIENSESKIEKNKVKLTNLLGLLLDNQGFSNQIIIDHTLTSIRDLVEKNRKKISLDLKPILDITQTRIVSRYLLLNDIYFTSNKTNQEQDTTQIITFARKVEFIKPKEIYKTNILASSNSNNSSDEELLQLNSFREKYNFNKNMYLDYDWIKEKVDKYLINYGLEMYKKSNDNLKEIFLNQSLNTYNYWEGKRFLSKANLRDSPIYTLLYLEDTQEIFYKTGNDSWFIVEIDKQTNINLFLRIITDPIKNWNYWLKLNKDNEDNEDNEKLQRQSNELPTGEYFLIRTSSNFEIARLYRKIDELSQNNFFSLNPTYDKLIKLPNDLDTTNTQLERLRLFKIWVESISKQPMEQKMFVENIIIDLNQRVINIFDDISAYLIFYQQEDFSELYLNKDISLNKDLNSWWSSINFENVLISGTQLGQCILPASFGISKIQETPPIYKFVYNRNLYHTFWDPLQTYINDLEKFISNKFKTTRVNQTAPIARFCIFNNPSLRLYLSKYVACNSDICYENMKGLKEPERCGSLKLKYQELMNLKMRTKCFFDKKTENDTDNTQNSNDKTMTNMTNDDNVNQAFGFNKLILLNIIEYSLKLHDCQTERIEIKSCQDLLNSIDTKDQKKDLKLGSIEIDRQNDLYSNYDRQLSQYHQILHNQEIKQLEPLNILANKDLNENKKKYDLSNPTNIMKKYSSDLYSIINDFSNISTKSTNGSNSSSNQIEEFDNQLNNNMDLTDDKNTISNYKKRLENQIKGIYSKDNNSNIGMGMSYFTSVKNIFYQVFDILTKDGRIMSSGILMLIIAFSMYFIDISS